MRFIPLAAFFSVSFGLLLWAWLAVGNTSPYPPVSVKVQAVQIGPHSYYIPGLSGAASPQNEGFMSNAGFVITPAGVVVFDSLGTPSLAQAMLAEIRKLTDAPIRRVILSHFHADHSRTTGLQGRRRRDLGPQARARGHPHRRGQAALRAAQGSAAPLGQ